MRLHYFRQFFALSNDKKYASKVQISEVETVTSESHFIILILSDKHMQISTLSAWLLLVAA